MNHYLRRDNVLLFKHSVVLENPIRLIVLCLLFNEGTDFSFRLSFRKAYVRGGGGKGGTTASRASRSRESSVSRFAELSNDIKLCRHFS